MKQKKTPLRLCIVCNEMKDKKDLIRIVKTQEDICLDITGKKNGRGAYICKKGDCVNLLRKRGSLERSFKMSINKEIYENLIKELEMFNAE